MQASQAYAAHAAKPSSTASEHASVAPALYRAALGPVNTAHYLAAFERLDMTGRMLPGWNWAAALCTLGWLVFRRLWRAALVYLAAVLSGGLLLFAIGHAWLALPPPMMAGLALAGILAACAVPGLYGDALLHAVVQRRIRRAVMAAPTMREATALLERQAGSRRRLVGVVAGGVGFVLLAAATWMALAGGQGREDRQAQQESPTLLSATAQPPDAPAAPGQGDAPPSPQPPASVPAPSNEAMASLAPNSDGGGGAATTPREEPEPAAPPPQAPASASVAAPVPPAKRGKAAAARPQEAARKLYINVGLFADPANARRAHARLKQAGLPSTVREVVRADGRRLQRVRVGPFTSAAQANAAVARVRALGLEAVAAAE